VTLPRYTWDQATILGLATANGYRALNIPPGTIRRWAHQGHIRAVGKAPGGAHLYPITDVTRHAQTLKQRRSLQTKPAS
jgi:predicted site-specific integrase-resolvase